MESKFFKRNREKIYRIRGIPVSFLNLTVLWDSRPVSAAVSTQGTLLAFGMSSSEINVCFPTVADLERFNMERYLEKSNSRQNHARRVTRKRTSDGIELSSSSPSERMLRAQPELDHKDVEHEQEEEKSAQMINSMHGHEGPVYDLMFHPKTPILFSVGYDATLRAWDMRTMKCRCVYR